MTKQRGKLANTEKGPFAKPYTSTLPLPAIEWIGKVP
jgi:hypothetical protein